MAYELGPNGATFSPAITLTLSYAGMTLPAGVTESSLYIAWWNGTSWQNLTGTVNTTNKTVTVSVTHFTQFALFGIRPAATTTPPVTTSPQPAPAPSVSITAPANGASVPAGNVVVSAAVQNFTLLTAGGANVTGQGHLHYYLDVTIPTTPGAPAVTGAGTYQVSPNLSATWQNLAPGAHTLGVQLVNNDHTPLVPPVTATVNITVQAPATTTPPATSTTPPATTPTTTTPTPTPSGPSGTNWGLIIGIIIAAIVVIVLIVVLMRRRRA
jgi:hypothetical protein